MNNEGKNNSLISEDIASTGTGSKLGTKKSPEAGSEDTKTATPIATETPQSVEAIEQQVDADGSPSLSVDDEPRTDEAASSIATKQKLAELPDACPEDANPSVPMAIEEPEAVEATQQQVAADGSPSSSVEPEPRTDQAVPSIAVKPVFVKKHQSFFEEQPLPLIEMTPRIMSNRTRREVLAFGIGAVAMAASAGFLLPQATLSRLGVRRGISSRGKEWLLNNALRVDDDVAEVLYSHNRMVPTYTKSQITQIKNNYNGVTPDSGYISGWNLTLDGLASGLSVCLDIRRL
jgi:hypothetical protein